MKLEPRVVTALAILAGTMVVIALGSAVVADVTSDPAYETPEEAIETLDDGTQLWAYTSRAPSFDQRTLSINVVVYGEVSETRELLFEDPVHDWEDLDEDREDLAPAEDFEVDLNETPGVWDVADGANRWTWVNPPDSEPRWLSESYQLEDGDYLGHRHHIRAYEDPINNNWTVMQGHTEHWDWFHLRHTVHTIEETQLVIEDEFEDRESTQGLIRLRFGNDQSSDADGWVTIIDLDGGVLGLIAAMTALGAFGATASLNRVQSHLLGNRVIHVGLRAFGLVLGLVAAFLLVRLGAVGIERVAPDLNPKVIAGVFYPALVIGMPIIAYLFARKLDATMAFSVATVGFVAAVFIDYTLLGVLVIPIETFVHRAAMAVGIGLIAAGASESVREQPESQGLVRSGVILWLAAVIIPLLQFL